MYFIYKYRVVIVAFLALTILGCDFQTSNKVSVCDEMKVISADKLLMASTWLKLQSFIEMPDEFDHFYGVGVIVAGIHYRVGITVTGIEYLIQDQEKQVLALDWESLGMQERFREATFYINVTEPVSVNSKSESIKLLNEYGTNYIDVGQFPAKLRFKREKETFQVEVLCKRANSDYVQKWKPLKSKEERKGAP